MPHSKSSSNLRVQFIQHRCTQSIDEEDKWSCRGDRPVGAKDWDTNVYDWSP
jgi:hypothetical protein